MLCFSKVFQLKFEVNHVTFANVEEIDGLAISMVMVIDEVRAVLHGGIMVGIVKKKVGEEETAQEQSYEAEVVHEQEPLSNCILEQEEEEEKGRELGSGGDKNKCRAEAKR